jgi:hypothetical protein
MMEPASEDTPRRIAGWRIWVQIEAAYERTDGDCDHANVTEDVELRGMPTTADPVAVCAMWNLLVQEDEQLTPEELTLQTHAMEGGGWP